MSDFPSIAGRSMQASNVVKYNDQTYVQNIMLCNQKDDPVALNAGAIQELVIEDNVFDWYVSGTLTFIDNFNVFERGTSGPINTNPYKFRTDGRDLLLVDIMPNFDGDDQENERLIIDSSRYDLWLLHYRFAIYDVEDISQGNNSQKTYKLYFWEEAYQKMLDKNIEWSTGASTFNKNRGKKPLHKMTNYERSIRAGEAVVDLLKTAGFTKEVDETLIDKGDSENLILYTSPSTSTVADDLTHILASHVSESEKDPCIFSLVRSKEESGEPSRFALVSYSKLFQQAGKEANAPGELQREHFYLNETGPQGSPIMLPKAPTATQSNDRDFKISGWNTILSFRFTDTAGVDNNVAYSSRPQYHHCSAERQFVFDYGAHATPSVRSFFQDHYIKQLYNKDKQGSLMTLNAAHTKGLNVTPIHNVNSNNSTTRLAHGRNAMLKAGLQMSACLSFGVMGLTTRQSSTFIGLDKLHGDTDTDFDNRLLGQWYVTSVKHTFGKGTYINYITAVKPHNFKTLNRLPEDIT